MNEVIVFDINPYEVISKMKEAGIEEIDNFTVIFKEFENEEKKQFIPPIYQSLKFQKLFDALTKATSEGQLMSAEHMKLLLNKQQGKNEVVLQYTDQTEENISLQLTDQQYDNMLKVLLSGGLREVSHLEKKTVTFMFLSLQTVYSVFMWSHIPSFLYIKSSTERNLVEALARVGISLNQTSGLSLQDIYDKYHLPFTGH